MGGSKNNGIPKSSILIGVSIVNHPFWGTLIFGNTRIDSTRFPFLPAAMSFFCNAQSCWVTEEKVSWS